MQACRPRASAGASLQVHHPGPPSVIFAGLWASPMGQAHIASLIYTIHNLSELLSLDNHQQTYCFTTLPFELSFAHYNIIIAIHIIKIKTWYNQIIFFHINYQLNINKVWLKWLQGWIISLSHSITW